MLSIYVTLLVGLISSCYGVNPLRCYSCQSDSQSNIAPGCFDPFDADGRNVGEGLCNAAVLSLKKLGPKGLSLGDLVDSSNQRADDDFDYECGTLEITEPISGFKQITRSCFLKEGDHECEEALELLEGTGLVLSKCLLCEQDDCNTE